MLGTFLCTIAAFLGAQESKSAIREELAQYYQSSKMPPGWEVSMQQLASKSADERHKAAQHLVDLMDQSYQDEKSGKAPWQATPFWGGPMENPARSLRSAIVASLDKTPAESEVLPVVRWLLANEPQMRLQETVAGFLGKIDGKEVEVYRRTLILQPHANAVVMGMLLAQLEERKADLAADRLKELCHHHRKVIRDNARKLNQTLKGADPGPFDSVQSLKSPALRKTLDKLQALMIDLPAQDAEFVKVTTKYLEKGEVKQTSQDQGWLLKQEKEMVVLFSPFGNRETHRDKEKTKITVGKAIENGYQSWQIDVVTSMSVDKVDIADYVKDIVAVRAKGNQDFELSPRGGLTGQFQGQGASLVEAILVAWLDRAGKHEMVAAVLLPALDTLYEDQHIAEMARHQLGAIVGNRMLVAFVGDRDYPETLKLAQTLAKNYPDTQFYEYAKGLSEQLPRRMDDFKTFRLPTPKEWAEIKKKRPRREQIDFLCQRMRLLNCFQWGQPGGYSFGSTQYAEPCGLSANAAWGLNRGKTEVINPFSELTGQRGVFMREDNKERGLDLKVADIPALVPYLREDWYLLCVSFWRDFHPNRDLGRSRPFFAGWINDLAQHDVCELAKFEKMAAKEQEAHLKRIVDWAEANKDKTQEELLANAVRAEVEKKAKWRDVADRIEALVKMKSREAIGFVEHYLHEHDEDGYYLPDMLAYVQTLNPKKATEWSKKFLDHKSGRLRMQCAMMLFDAGDKDLALPVLAEMLKKGSSYDIGAHAEKAVEALLKLDTGPAKEAAHGILRNKYLQGPRTGFDGSGIHAASFSGDGLNRSAIILLLEKAGYPEGYEVYLELLDAKGSDFGNASYGTPIAKLAVNEILACYGNDNVELQKVRELKDFEEKRVAIRRWVEAKIKKPSPK
jgi:hypothetical protein